MIDYCQLWLTCADKKEADKIAGNLLAKRLVACVRQMPVTSDYRWQGKIEHAGEVLLVMAGRLDLFDQIEQEITKFHSYGTFVLEAVPIAKVSQKATRWLDKEITHA